MLAGFPPFYDENPFGIYEKILLGRISFPSHFDSSARDLVKKLLASGMYNLYFSNVLDIYYSVISQTVQDVWVILKMVLLMSKNIDSSKVLIGIL